MNGYGSASASKDGRDESDDEEEYDEDSGGTRLLGFMFGNVDNAGDLDVDYLDEEAKEHLSTNLAVLADKLGPAFTDIHLSVKSSEVPVDAVEQDYDVKAADAVNYEDIDEQYEGPEIQVAGEEHHLLPEKEYISAEVSLATLKPAASLFDDENYDEEEEVDTVDKENEVSAASVSGEQGDVGVLPPYPEGEKSLEDDLQVDASSTEEDVVDGAEDPNEDDADTQQELLDAHRSTPLPVLCVEDGMVILRFSEIFGIHEPLKRREKREQRYSTHKDKYKIMDISSLVEEDEETFLNGSGQGYAYSKHAHAGEHDLSVLSGNDLELEKFGSVEGSASSAQYDEQRKGYLSARPMKEDFTVNLSIEWQSISSPLSFPLDQHDWEENILWDNSPSVSDDSVRCSEITGPDMDVVRATELQSGQDNLHSELSTIPDGKDAMLHNPSLLEPLSSRRCSDHEDDSFAESRWHPQLLRLESQLDKDNEIVKENVAVDACQSDAMKRIDKLTLQNIDMMEGCWSDNIIWEPLDIVSKPKLILDLQDEQMLFEILDSKDSKHLQLHAGAMIVTRPVKLSSGTSLELSGRKYNSEWQFNIANDKFYMNGKISQQLQPNSSKRTAHGIRIHHSAPALKLQTMKLKLSNKDIANFHRPKALWYPHDNEVAVKEQGKLPTQGTMKVIVKSLGGKGTKLHVDTEETVSSVKAKASKKLDFKPAEIVKLFYLGKELEDAKSLGEQNVQPNSLLHLVRTKVHLLPKAQKLPAENKSLRPPGAFKKKSDLSVKDGHVFLMEYCEERPLLLNSPGMGANLCTYYQKSSPGDQGSSMVSSGNNSLGNLLTLDPGDKSPFLGEIKPGCSQSSIETNMYRAPVYSHKVPSTDFLLVRSAKGKISIRRIDKIAVVGQQEPLMEVISPGSKNVQTYNINRLLVYVYREFSAAGKRGLLPCICVDELSAQFPNLSEAIIRKKMKECALLRRDAKGRQVWSMKRTFNIPSEGDLRKLVAPEHVCSYESMQAGLYRLKHLGITQLTLPASISSAMTQLPDEAIALAAASHIERELLITPWNLSSNFVSCTSQDRENIERLEITGVGDPSGRGLGFSYVRTVPKAPMASAMVKKKAGAGRGGSTVTGTDADLRRLSMEAAREVLLKFNVPEEMIAKQTRWHRIAMIRKLSSEQAAAGVKVDPTTISKYARGQRMSFLQLQQQTREKCQEIWDRQVQSLSAVEDDEIGSESEANSDLDSFAGDLENLLDAEEFEDDEESNYESKHDKADGVKGIKMRRRPLQAQVEEEIEDEAAEAAELRRLLMDDDEAEQQKKTKKAKTVAEEVGSAPSKQSISGIEMVERVKKPNKIAKQIIRPVLPIVSHAGNESIKDPMEEESSVIKKHMPAKVKAMKKNGIPQGSQLKKLKILGDSVKMFKEKKSSRESFVCGACGQFGHMRTNKNCPKYGTDPEQQLENIDSEKAFGRTSSLDPSSQSHPKSLKKKLIPKSTTRNVAVEAPEDEKSSLKAIVVPVKFKCGSSDKHSEKLAVAPAQSSDPQPVTSDTAVNKSIAKASKLKIANKLKPEETPVESHKPSIVIRPPADTGRSQVEPHKPSIVIRPPTNTEREQVELHKHSIVIRPPVISNREQVESHKSSIVIRPPIEKEREQPQKKIIIKRPKETIDLDQVSQDGFEYRKTKRIVELSGFEKHGTQSGLQFNSGSSKRKTREEKNWWEEEEKRRNADRLREERERRRHEEEMRILEERERFADAEIRRYQESIRREREEEERQKAKKKKKKRKVDVGDEYIEDSKTRRNDRRIAERGRSSKRRSSLELGKYGAEHASSTKRRRAGEVGLSNILEEIVETLRENTELSFLFLKPVSKKEAPDYLDIVKRPMDLSTIRDKVRRMEYKDREDFRHDVWQIAYNAHMYNDGRNPGIPPLADQLLEVCDFLLDERSDSIAEAEAGIVSRNT